jgi:PTS system mannose-specific IIA component
MSAMPTPPGGTTPPMGSFPIKNGIVHTAVLVVTHGNAGAAMLEECRRLLGEGAIAAISCMSAVHGEPREALRARIAERVAQVDEGRGTLILVDLQGSTPCNQSVTLKRDGLQVEILCGVSLPMLIKIAGSDRARLTLAELAHEAAQTAIRSIRLGDGGPA